MQQNAIQITTDEPGDTRDHGTHQILTVTTSYNCHTDYDIL